MSNFIDDDDDDDDCDETADEYSASVPCHDTDQLEPVTIEIQRCRYSGDTFTVHRMYSVLM